MLGALIFLQKLRISPDAAFCVNDWTAFVIFITVIGGIGRIEGPILGTVVFFAAAPDAWPISAPSISSMLGLVAIVIMLCGAQGHLGARRRALRLAVFSA